MTRLFSKKHFIPENCHSNACLQTYVSLAEKTHDEPGTVSRRLSVKGVT